VREIGVKRHSSIKTTARKVFVCFLCLSFLLLTSRTSVRVVEAKERNIPIGEMISKGEVRFEARENSWKSVEPSLFPVFRGVKIKTDKGLSAIALENKSQIDVRQQSMISFTQDDQLSLFQGGIDFRVPPTAQMSFKVGSLFIIKPRVLQAARNSDVLPVKSEEMVGTLSLHANGSLTVRSVEGELSILDQDHIVLASLPPRETITIPSAVVSGKQRVMVAQVGDIEEEDKKSGDRNASSDDRGRASLPILFGNAAAFFLNAGVVGFIVGAALNDDDSDDHRPLCK
jgi:hypothetical protein